MNLPAIILLCIAVSDVYMHPPHHKGGRRSEEIKKTVEPSDSFLPHLYKGQPLIKFATYFYELDPNHNNKNDNMLSTNPSLNLHQSTRGHNPESSSITKQVKQESSNNSTVIGSLAGAGSPFNFHNLVDVQENGCPTGYDKDPNGTCQKIE